MGIKADGIALENFVKEYTQRATDKFREDYIQDSLNVANYISIARKEAVAKNLVERTTYVVDNKGNVTDVFKVNSPLRYIFFTLSVIDLYTNLIVDWDKPVIQYDLLAESGLIQILMSKVPQLELGEFQTIVDMVLNDTMQNEFTTQQFIRKEIDRISDIVKLLAPIAEPIIKPVANKIGEGIKDSINESN